MSSTSSVASGASASGLSEPECARLHSARSTNSVVVSSQSTGQQRLSTETSDHSTRSLPMSCVEDSPASHLAPLLEDEELPTTYGQKCSASSDQLAQHTLSPKTSKKRQSPSRLNVSMELATQRTTAVYQALIAGQTIKEIVGGSLHTPTRKANFVAPSMMKWPSCRRFVQAFGGREITPEQFEFLMGLPIGWTELEPSETRSSRKSRKRSAARS